MHAPIARLIHSRLDPTSPSHVLPSCVLGASEGFSGTTAKHAVIEAAAIAILLDREERREAEFGATTLPNVHDSVRVECLHYGVFEMFDESPHTMSFDDFLKSGGHYRMFEALGTAPAQLAIAGGEAPSDIMPYALELQLACSSARETGPLKFLQFFTEWAMLLRVVTKHEDRESTKYVIVGQEQLNWLQTVDSATGDNCRQCQRNLDGATFRKKFSIKASEDLA